MAPSNMFSYLRPGHAKRNASSLASPEPVSSPATLPPPAPLHGADYLSSPRLSENASYLSSSPVSPFPPQLPPIARVASKLDKAQATSTGESSTVAGHDREMLSPPQGTHEQSSPSYENKPSTLSSNYSNFSRSQTSLISGISEKLSSSSKGASTPTAAPAKAKSRLNLRNPMSLLMRRRSGQTLDPLSDDALVSQRSPSVVPPMPDNYDPSIRGHIVHDFNAPRLNRNFSHNNAYEGDPAQADVGRVSPPKLDREHTPVFREHFDDDTSYEQSQAAIRAEQLANKDFLTRNSVQFAPPAYSPAPPPMPKSSPPQPPPPAPPSSSPPPRQSFQTLDSGPSMLSPVHETSDPMDIPVEVTPRKMKSTKTPPPVRSRATSVTDPLFQPAGLPSHFTSRASRFSFQISGGADSAQEKILEERHKQKAAEKATRAVRMSTHTLDDEYDEYDMDDYDMDGGFEEEIPMLGEEDDFDGLGDQSMEASINAFDFSSLSLHPDLGEGMTTPNPPALIQTPVDASGMPIGFAMSEEMLQQLRRPMHGEDPRESIPFPSEPYAIGSSGPQVIAGDTAAPLVVNEPDLDDDMYFDDGLIGEQEEEDATQFDESVFDDPDGPLYERRIRSPPADVISSQRAVAFDSEPGYDADDDTMTRHLEKSEPSLAHQLSVAQDRTVPSFDNMNAYHSALANAATRAEAAGRFARKASVDVGQSSSDVEHITSPSDSRPSLVPDDGRFSQETNGFPPDDDGFGMTSNYVDDYDYSDYESNLEDDPMIAAANAEALAFDDEGFYGQEFGFYASAVGDSPNAWGGFFGPSGIGRTVSGRNAVREPNLTPITERSEYSTRNSLISLNHFRDSQQPLQSPGLAQLARMSPYGWPEEEDLTMEALMKLRKGAFGGSVVSLPGSTSNSPRNSSPMGLQFVPRMSSPAGNRMKAQNDSESESDASTSIEEDLENNCEHDDERLMDEAVNAAYDDDSDREDSAGEDRSESPTLTASDYNSLSSPSSQFAIDAPPLPLAAQLQALYGMQSPSHISPSMSHNGSLTSPSNTTVPYTTHGLPLLSLSIPQQPLTAPPSIDTSLSSLPALHSTTNGPHRQSKGFTPSISSSSPISPSGWRGGHSRNGSAADSVTYVRENDAAGEGRWVLERRRTAESGELELIAREFIESGRI